MPIVKRFVTRCTAVGSTGTLRMSYRYSGLALHPGTRNLEPLKVCGKFRWGSELSGCPSVVGWTVRKRRAGSLGTRGLGAKESGQRGKGGRVSALIMIGRGMR